MRFSLIGDSYPSQSPNQSCQRTINFYREVSEDKNAKTPAALLPCPGLRAFGTPLNPTSGGMRGALEINGRVFFAGATSLIEVLKDGTYKNWGAIPASVAPCSLAASGQQLLIAANGDLKVFDLTANTLTGISDPVGISQVGFSDGQFLALQADDNKFRISSILDATTWDPSDIFEVSVFPDNVVSMIVDHRELWLLGAKSSIVYFNSGDLNDPFQPLDNGFIEQGCGARVSAVRLDNSIFWLGADERGQAMIVRANGYSPQRVSNHAVEYAMQQYSRIDDAIAYGFQMNGHSFYRIIFPTADAAWEYDASTGGWHEPLRWDSDNAVWRAHRSSCHVFAFGKHLVGDPNSDAVFEMSDTILDDAGSRLRRQRVSGILFQEGNRLFHDRLRLDVETGQGPLPDLGGTATGFYSLSIADQNGDVWKVTVDDNGVIHATASSGIADTYYLDDSSGNTWQLGIDAASQELTTTEVTAIGAPLSLAMITSGTQLQTYLTIDKDSQEVQAQTGTSPTRGPQVNVEWSDDGGHTWKGPRVLSCGVAGDFLHRLETRRLGQARQRVYRITVDDPAYWRIMDGYVEARMGTQ